MSLCNTFRFFAVSTTIVLSIVGSPVPGRVNRHDDIQSKKFNGDLEQQGSITVELKSDDKGPNYINSLKLDDVKGATSSIPLNSESTKKNVDRNFEEITTSADNAAQNITATDLETTTSMPLGSDIHTISTENLNTTLGNQQSEGIVNDTSEFENTSTMDSLKALEKTIIKHDLRSPSNYTNNQNQVEDTNNNTTVAYTTPTTLLTTEIETTVNTETDTETSLPITNAEAMIPDKSKKSIKLTTMTGGVTAPSWKKYSIIERKRVATTTDEVITSTGTSTENMENLVSTLTEELITSTETPELMLKSESAQGRISLQEAITSDIPSLDKLKSDLLSKFTTKYEAELTTTPLSIEQNVTETDMATTFITTSFASTFNVETPNTVSSKRAGYLDLSEKVSTAENYITLKPNDTESLQGPFDGETSDAQDESLDEKTTRVESQSQLAEDAIKEELLREEILNDKEEISTRHRDEGKQISTDTRTLPNTQNDNSTQFDDNHSQPPQNVSDENLSVKPINSDKGKNTVLYSVNPNYKPLKKIEVQPAKPFVRDPDDNSWRNESLSSLGIVFKPKNSSKPFTQVLKNKTETEWNNLPEKDIKSEVPDLRVRLEQIAQKRKSKKKKIDSFGNVFYTDYEESSSSEENHSTPQVAVTTLGTVSTTDVTTSGVTIVTPIQTTSVSTSTARATDVTDVPAVTTSATPIETTQASPKKEHVKFSGPKHPKMFNLFDYYEANEDEDLSEYLNMAKIDLKKYNVPVNTPFTPYTSPPLYTHPTIRYTPERKGTIQYFPPTKRPKKPRYNNIESKINPLALTDSPKHVLPISYHKLTTPYDTDVYYTAGPVRFRAESAPKNFNRNPYLTTPPLTTVPEEEYGVIGNDAGYNRPAYVIKHYKDYATEAREREYSLTERPPPTTTKDKANSEDYDYESAFRKDLLDRFVANFNDKGGRFGAEFPVVYNNSIVHGAADDREAAMSRAFFRRPAAHGADCDNVTVELSPAYELHYYVPEQEERQEVEPKPLNQPVSYRL